MFLFNRSPLPGNPRLRHSVRCLSTLYHCTHLEQKGACMLSCFSRVQLFVTSWTAVHQAPLSMEFLKQEHCSGLPFPSPGDLPSLGIRKTSLTSPALAGGFFTTDTTWEIPKQCHKVGQLLIPSTKEETKAWGKLTYSSHLGKHWEQSGVQPRPPA